MLVLIIMAVLLNLFLLLFLIIYLLKVVLTRSSKKSAPESALGSELEQKVLEESQEPQIVIDPAKAFCQRMKFVIRMKAPNQMGSVSSFFINFKPRLLHRGIEQA